MRYILDDVISTLQRGEDLVVATIIRNSGSAPRSMGARMLIRKNGSSVGTIGGGYIEAACQQKASSMLADDGMDGSLYEELNFRLDAATVAAEGMICGGSADVLLQRISPERLSLYCRLNELYRNDAFPLLLTRLCRNGEAPREFLLQKGERCASADIPDAVVQQILHKARRSSFIVEDDGYEYFIEPLVKPARVHLIGAGHVALSTAQLAAFVGFSVVVMDDRKEFANRARYPAADEVRVLDSFADCLQNLHSNDYVIIVTRGHLHDRDVVVQALRTQAGYIGMIGSKKKRAAVFTSLLEEGFSEMDLARIHSPIGISIEADSPEEIAVSIVAELIKTRAFLERV